MQKTLLIALGVVLAASVAYAGGLIEPDMVAPEAASPSSGRWGLPLLLLLVLGAAALAAKDTDGS
jgi:hypothetical protein